MGNISYIIIYALAFELLFFVAIYAYKYRHIMDEMHGMMVGMTLGMFSGLVTATIYLIPSGDFLYGVIIGSIVGLLFGVPLGKLGGHLGIIEGVMAGPMGGMMGAMLGQMIRPYDIGVFMPFFMFIVLITMIGITYAISCKANLVNTAEPVEAIKPEINNLDAQAEEKIVEEIIEPKLNNKFATFWTGPIVILMAVSLILPFSVTGYTKKAETVKGTQAIVKKGIQEINMVVDATSYSPSTLIAQKDIPLKINVKMTADDCTRQIIFPDLGIDKIFGADSSGVIDIKNPKPGTYRFTCPMNMVEGKLIVR